MPYPACFPEELYDQISIDDYLESLRAKVLRYCAKLTKSGGMLEIEIYPINPVWKNNKGLERAKSLALSRKAQKNLNDKNTSKHVSRLIHANFTSKDIWVTFEYSHENMPVDMQTAIKHLKNYLKRLRRHIKKHELPALKYIYVTERVENMKTGKIHTHHHIIMNFQDRDTAETLWTLGGRTQARRLQPDKDGSLEGLARYISKPETKEGHRKGTKTYVPSKNLVKPEVIRSEHRIPKTNYKLSQKRVTEMVLDENKVVEVLEEKYNGYKIVTPLSIRFSDYTAGAYLYARMTKKPVRNVKRKC